MGFMDKVKSQATALAEKAQEGARAGQEKLSQVQAKRHSDALLLELGGIVYLERAGRPQAGGEARAEAIVSELRTFEAANGPVTVTSAVAQPGAAGTFIPGGAGTAPAPQAGGGMPDAGSSVPGGGVPFSDPTGGGIPTAAPDAGIPTAAPDAGIPTASPGGGIPTASYGSDEETESPT
jgi:hypothetical protein